MKFPFVSWCFYSFPLRLWTARLSQTCAHVVGARDPPGGQARQHGDAGRGLDLVARVLVDPTASVMEASPVPGESRMPCSCHHGSCRTEAAAPAQAGPHAEAVLLAAKWPSIPCGGDYISW